MRVAMLTGGGDCPGLNAVMRAVVRKGERDLRRRARRLPRRLAGRASTAPADAARRRDAAGAPCPAAARSSARRAPTRSRSTAGVERVQGDASTDLGIDALIAIGGEDTLGVAAKLRRRGRARSSACPRPSTTTCRPPSSPSASTPRCRSPPTPSTGCTPPPRPTTGSWSSRSWAATPATSPPWAGIAGGATMILIPEEPFDIDEVCDAIRPPPRGRPLRLDRRRRRGRRAQGGHAGAGQSARSTQFGHVRLGGIGNRPGRGDRGPHRLRDPGRPSSATSSAAARRRRSTGCSPPASASPPSTPCTTAPSARWSRCRPARSSGCRWPRPWASSRRSTPTLYHGVAEVFFAG